MESQKDDSNRRAFCQPPRFRSVPFVELRCFLSSQVEVISPFVDQLMRFVARFRDLDGSQLDIESAFREALTNAIVHRNQEDPHKTVSVACRCTLDGEVSITIRDNGFDSDIGPNSTPIEKQILTYGPVVNLMTWMDDVRFEQGGAVVYMHKQPNAGAGAKR